MNLNKYISDNKLYCIQPLYEGGRMFVGAISVLYMIAMGLTPSQVASIKMIQAVVNITMEYPSGVLGDYLGNRNNLVFSSVFGIAGFVLYIIARNFILFGLGELFLALCLSFWSGSYQAFISDEITDNKERNIFFHKSNALTKTTVCVCGLIGGTWFLSKYRFSYILSLVSYIILFLFCWFLFKNRASSANSLKKAIKKNTKDLLLFIENRNLFIVLLVCILLKFSLLPIIHFWQPYFIHIKTPRNLMGLIFSIYVGFTAIFSYLYSKLKKQYLVRNSWAPLFFIYIILFNLMSLNVNYYIKILIFSFLQTTQVLMYTDLCAIVVHNAPETSKASMLSFIGLFERIGSLIGLSMLGNLLITKSIDKIYCIWAYISLSFFICLMIMNIIVCAWRNKHDLSIDTNKL